MSHPRDFCPSFVLPSSQVSSEHLLQGPFAEINHSRALKVLLCDREPASTEKDNLDWLTCPHSFFFHLLNAMSNRQLEA